MAGSQRVYRQRIKSTQTLKKVFRAMEMIAASRIGRARQRALQGTPFTKSVTHAVSNVAAHARLDNPLLVHRKDTNRVAVFVITSDRGMAGAYSASVLREAERMLADLTEKGKEPLLFVSGRRGVSYFRFRKREVVRSWENNSDSPQASTAAEMSNEILTRYLASAADGGIAEVFTISTRFVSMVRQVVEVRRMLPIEVVEAADVEQQPAMPLYEFEPSADEVLAGLMPLYLRSRMQSVLYHAAASELAARQQAMHTATENAEELITNYTRLANAARQADITQEITEIVSGSDALAAS